ncbi:CBS domain-containing protein [Leptodesmis sp.]|uniref:CBS domain-containing protein n=1 Tax=Leptodesmis sp. TaxID=3100501 RepID=UPI0040534A84
MTQEVVTVPDWATVEEAVKLMKLKGLRSLVVDRRNDEDTYGLVTEADITDKVVAYGKDPKKVRVSEVMTKPCVVINPDLAIEYVARLFAQTGVDRAPVIRGDLIGIVSVADILFKSDFLTNPKLPLVERALQAANAEAQAIAEKEGTESEAFTAAWNKVKELEAEKAYLQAGAASQPFAGLDAAVAAPQPVTV